MQPHSLPLDLQHFHLLLPSRPKPFLLLQNLLVSIKLLVQRALLGLDGAQLVLVGDDLPLELAVGVPQLPGVDQPLLIESRLQTVMLAL